MYGDGFSARSARYTSTGRAWNGTDRRWLSTTWKMSPARMYSFDFSTAAMKPSRVKPETKSALVQRAAFQRLRIARPALAQAVHQLVQAAIGARPARAARADRRARSGTGGP